MTEYVEKAEFSDMEDNMRLLNWKKYISERKQQRKRNIKLAKLSKSILNKKASLKSGKLPSQKQHSNVATLNCDLDIAPYLNCNDR